MLAELQKTEIEAEESKALLLQTSSKLQRREDDLVLMIHQYEQQQHAHKKLTREISAATDGSALEVSRLRSELSELNSTCAQQRSALDFSKESLEQVKSPTLPTPPTCHTASAAPFARNISPVASIAGAWRAARARGAARVGDEQRGGGQGGA